LCFKNSAIMSTVFRYIQRYHHRVCPSSCKIKHSKSNHFMSAVTSMQGNRTFSTQNKGKYSEADRKKLIADANRDGFVILKQHLNKDLLSLWLDKFQPLLKHQIDLQKKKTAGEGNRGSERYYVTLPFLTDPHYPFQQPSIYEDADILAIVEGMVGFDPVMCQLATDTPLKGSVYQEIHRDCPPLFPESEWQKETPSFQLAVNFPLVNVTPDNGPFEVARGTHLLSRQEGLDKINNGEVELESICMDVGDVMVRDVRGLHRGTPNKTDIPRPMVVIGYSRRWMYRPEVGIKVLKRDYDILSYTGRKLLRFEQRVDGIDPYAEESYKEFAFDDDGRIIDANTAKKNN